LILAGAVLVVAGGGVLAFVLFRESILPPRDGGTQTGQSEIINGEIRNVRNSDERVFRLKLPRSVWKLDHGIKSGMKAVVALQRTDPDAWLAVAAKDFGTRKPRNAELVKEGIEHLESYFGESLELSEKAEVKELAGQRAQRLEFKGQLKTVTWWGECYMIAHHGIGYWFYLAAPTREEAQQEMIDLHKDNQGLALIDERRGWREQPPKMESFKGTKLPLALSAPEGVWEKFPAEDQDERGDLFLFGRYLKEKDNRKNASVLIVLLDKQPLKEGMKAARTYFEEKKKEEDKDYQVVPVAEKADGTGTPGEVGDRPGRILDLKLLLREEPKRYQLLAVAEGADRLIAIRCDCTWENRQIWRQDFLDLLRTFRLKKTE
jgi:hypothetical protein